MKILVTGAAGFIGFYIVKRLIDRGEEVVGIDSINNYYSVDLKFARLAQTGISREKVQHGKYVISSIHSNYKFIQLSLEDRDAMSKLFAEEGFDIVVNLAAQAGVRYSIENPFAYIQSNLVGFATLLECCRHSNIKHLVYASSSSVYGGNTKVPFSESDSVDNPVSLYAATKKSNELLASAYTKLYGFPATGLRFFTVYGPWGRPDMAPMLFTKSIKEGKPIKVFNNGNLRRDFTYIDDIVEGVLKVLEKIPEPQSDGRRHTVYNIGCSHPVMLMDFIGTLEDALGKKAEKIFLPMQQGDVYQTYADTSKLEKETGYKPSIELKEGISEFIKWYNGYYK